MCGGGGGRGGGEREEGGELTLFGKKCISIMILERFIQDWGILCAFHLVGLR